MQVDIDCAAFSRRFSRLSEALVGCFFVFFGEWIQGGMLCKYVLMFLFQTPSHSAVNKGCGALVAVVGQPNDERPFQKGSCLQVCDQATIR
jgi:hypothetical protein